MCFPLPASLHFYFSVFFLNYDNLYQNTYKILLHLFIYKVVFLH